MNFGVFNHLKAFCRYTRPPWSLQMGCPWQFPTSCGSWPRSRCRTVGVRRQPPAAKCSQGYSPAHLGRTVDPPDWGMHAGHLSG